MLRVYKYVLGPILLGQAKWLRRTALRLPEADGPRGGLEGNQRSAITPARLLFVGDSSVAGVGVKHQEQALAQPAARLLAQRIERLVGWQLVAKSGVNVQEALCLLQHSALRPADVLVTGLGTNDVTSQRRPQQFLDDYARLIDTVCGRTGARSIVVTGLPPLRILPAAPQPLRWYLGCYAAQLDDALRNWLCGYPNSRYISLEWAAKPLEMARDRFHPGVGQYYHWAELVALSIAELLQADDPRMAVNRVDKGAITSSNRTAAIQSNAG